jgi:GrpB-like predicted nucleotidyltransferase (UPF0157 family)
MTKRVNELTKEEMASLFPVELSSYNIHWPDLYKREQELLVKTLTDNVLRIEHFGSTSIPNLSAKPTIDILVELPDDETISEHIIEKMKNISYDFFWQGDEEPPYKLFVKGYNITGVKEQTYHVHMGPGNHKLWDRLYFRDYLKEHGSIAREYEKLKSELAEIHKFDRVAYRIAKTAFVTKITELAKKSYFQNS